MDISDMLASTGMGPGDSVELSGWLVDTNDGLCVLGDHYPEDYDHSCRVLIRNGNIIYPILESVPSLGGGWSALFHKTILNAIVECRSPWIVKAEALKVERDRGSGNYVDIDIRPEIVAAHVGKKGDYKFNRPRDPMRDWLDD